MSNVARRLLVGASLTLLGLSVACGGPATESPWDQAQNAPAVESTGEVLAGSQFNPFFPSDGDGYRRVFTQEKQGFAEAKLQQDGKVVAMLSVNDIAANPAAGDKYAASGQQIDGFPAAPIGSTATGVLVGDRLQVKVLSRDAAFTAAEREAWLSKFDLDGLADLVE